MSIDQRTRSDSDTQYISPSAFFDGQFQAYAKLGACHISDWLSKNPMDDVSFECDGNVWHINASSALLKVNHGIAQLGLHVRISADDFSALINDQLTPIAFLATNDLNLVRGNFNDYLNWWLILRAVIDQRTLYTPGTIAFKDRNGADLDLTRKFTLEDPLDEMRHFLETAGFLHLKNVFKKEEMNVLSKDMDLLQDQYSKGDGISWWARCANGSDRLVRMQRFDEKSQATASLLKDSRFKRIGDIPGLDMVHNSLENNQIEALIKPLNVVEGLSDLPWHKDCAQGRHSYICAGLTVGISVSGSDATSGQICLIAGSHRGLMRPSLFDDISQLGLPVIEVPTEAGDITIHLSCTLHMAQAPTHSERRVMYTGFRFADVDVSSTNHAKQRLNSAREQAHLNLNDKPSA